VDDFRVCRISFLAFILCDKKNETLKKTGAEKQVCEGQ